MSIVSAVPDRLGDRYVVGELLGRGGMADVYRATDEVLGRSVAAKVLRDVENEDRFTAEARTLAALAHPGLVTVLDAGVTGGRPWLVMELVEGTTLADRCATGPVPAEEVARVGRRLAEALAHVHGRGLVHRDVKPANVLLAHDGRVLLADFGIARLVEAAALTSTGFTLGTAAYLAPEQVAGDAVGPAADVYALGLVLLEALTGRRAFPGPAGEAAVARLHREPSIPAELPPRWVVLLQRLTARDPARRPSAADAAADLRRVGLELPAVTRRLPRASSAPAAGDGGTRLLTTALPRAAAGPALRDRVQQVPLWLWAAAAGVLLVVLVVAAAVGGSGSPPASSVPPGLPSQVATPLQDLHDAVDGR